jgi:hypothetical protein
LPPKLDTMVNRNDSYNDFPVVGPEDAAILKGYLTTPEPPLAERDQCANMLANLSIALPKSKSSDMEAAQKLKIYCDSLSDIPLKDLQSSYHYLLRNCLFFPSIKEIRDAALSSTAKREFRKMQARKLLYKHNAKWSDNTNLVDCAQQIQRAIEPLVSKPGSQK